MSIKLEKRWIEKINESIEKEFQISDYRLENSSCYRDIIDNLDRLSYIPNDFVSFEVLDNMLKQTEACRWSSIVNRFNGFLCYCDPLIAIVYDFLIFEDHVELWISLKNITPYGREYDEPYLLEDGEKIGLDTLVERELDRKTFKIFYDEDKVREQLLEEYMNAYHEIFLDTTKTIMIYLDDIEGAQNEY